MIMFVKSYKRDWLFPRNLVLTPLLEEARAFFCDSLFELEVPIREFIAKLPCRVNPVNDYGMNELIAYNQFYIIAKHTRKGIEYYCSEKEVYDSKLKRRIQVPEFTKDINKAEFSKSIDSVNAILTRIRQNSTSYGVFLTIENDLNKPNIIFALTNKISKKTRYLKSYDLNSKSSDRVLMCDYMDSALAVKYDEALKIYDDLHAKHKNLLVNLHIRNGGENTHAKDFKYKRESIQIGFKLKV